MLDKLDEWLTAIERAAWEARTVSDELVQASGELKGWTKRGVRRSAIGWTLALVAGEYRLFGIYSAFLPKERAADALAKIHARSARRVYRTSVEQMGAFLKVGQLLSARRDLLPESWIEELSRLQDQVPPESFTHVKAVVEADLAAPLAERFSEFEEQPMAAASIGQVHRAVTLDGREVAVKVQRPDVAAQMEEDVQLLEGFLSAMRGMLPPSDYVSVVAELRQMLLREIDYREEAAAMEDIAQRLAGMPGVSVPRPIAELSGPRVLTMPLVRGEKITDALDKGDDELRSRVLSTLLEVYLKQILELGRFQADPHPGNFLVTDSGELVLLDFGCTRHMTDETRRGYAHLVRAFVTGDGTCVAEWLERLGFRTQSGKPDTLFAFASALLDVFRRGTAEGTLAFPTKEQLMQQAAGLMEAAQKDPVTRVPGEFVMLARVFGTLGGMLSHYRPHIDYARVVLPHLFRAEPPAA
jgi:ubiquinone biosynthesis protein